MIYIVYECNKTNTIQLSKQLYIVDMLMSSNTEFERTKLREEENENLTMLFLALCNALDKMDIQEDIKTSLKRNMNEIRNYGIEYASAHEMKQRDDLHYLICLENRMVENGTGIQFVIYRSEMDEAIVGTYKDGLLRVYINLERLEEDNILTRFVCGMDELMVEEPSIQRLERVCGRHPLFKETLPYLLMFLCNCTHMKIQMHSLKNEQSVLH